MAKPFKLDRGIQKAIKSVQANYDNLVRSLAMPFILGNVFFIVLYLVMFNYVQKLEETGCACSSDWRRHFIYWYLVFATLFTIVSMVMTSYGGMFTMGKLMGYGILNLIYGILTIIFVVVAIQYVHRLKVEKCKCSEAVGRNVIQIVSWFYVILWAVVFMLSLHSLIVGTTVMATQ